ncbi:MAG: PAS domain S-box protein, partial [Deltaproteobacteria bacterium]|nr:PAS domain S-box protein [Deltaproteobacteria bacterium]
MKELTENGKTQRLSAGSEELFTKVFNYSNDAIFVFDPAHDRILDVNPKACSLLGYSREELLSIPVSAVHPKEMPQLLTFAESVFEQGHGWTNEFGCLTKTGQRLPAEISASFIEMAGRRCLVALVRDISDRKRAEEALRQYSENLEKLVEERTAQLRQAYEEISQLNARLEQENLYLQEEIKTEH